MLYKSIRSSVSLSKMIFCMLCATGLGLSGDISQAMELPEQTASTATQENVVVLDAADFETARIVLAALQKYTLLPSFASRVQTVGYMIQMGKWETLRSWAKLISKQNYTQFCIELDAWRAKFASNISGNEARYRNMIIRTNDTVKNISLSLPIYKYAHIDVKSPIPGPIAASVPSLLSSSSGTSSSQGSVQGSRGSNDNSKKEDCAEIRKQLAELQAEYKKLKMGYEYVTKKLQDAEALINDLLPVK